MMSRRNAPFRAAPGPAIGFSVAGPNVQSAESRMSEMIGRQVAIAATRQMAVELWTEEMMALLIETGLVTRKAAALMLERLHARLWCYPEGTPTKLEYRIDPDILAMEAERVAWLHDRLGHGDIAATDRPEMPGACA